MYDTINLGWLVGDIGPEIQSQDLLARSLEELRDTFTVCGRAVQVFGKCTAPSVGEATQSQDGVGQWYETRCVGEIPRSEYPSQR